MCRGALRASSHGTMTLACPTNVTSEPHRMQAERNVREAAEAALRASQNEVQALAAKARRAEKRRRRLQTTVERISEAAQPPVPAHGQGLSTPLDACPAGSRACMPNTGRQLAHVGNSAPDAAGTCLLSEAFPPLLTSCLTQKAAGSVYCMDSEGLIS